MNYEKVLKQLETNELTTQEAFNKLYLKKPGIRRRATFVKMSLRVPEEGKGINRLFKVLFLIPFPLIFARIGLRISKRFIKDDDINIDEIINIIKYSKGTKVSVDTKDAQIDIKII